MLYESRFLTLGEIYGEEIRSPGNFRAAVVRHGLKISCGLLIKNDGFHPSYMAQMLAQNKKPLSGLFVLVDILFMPFSLLISGQGYCYPAVSIVNFCGH